MTLKDLRLLLIQRDMTVSELAREIGCSRQSLYVAMRSNARPRVLRRLRAWYRQNTKGEGS